MTQFLETQIFEFLESWSFGSLPYVQSQSALLLKKPEIISHLSMSLRSRNISQPSQLFHTSKEGRTINFQSSFLPAHPFSFWSRHFPWWACEDCFTSWPTWSLSSACSLIPTRISMRLWNTWMASCIWRTVISRYLLGRSALPFSSVLSPPSYFEDAFFFF